MNSDLPPFDEAVEQFCSFIKGQGRNDRIVWIFRQDVIEIGRRIFVRLPLSDDEQLVAVKYQEGVRRGLGVALQVYCWVDDRPLCYIWNPKDQMDAEYRMLSGLKLSVPSDPDSRFVTGVKSGIYWRYLVWRERRRTQHNWADDIPCR